MEIGGGEADAIDLFERRMMKTRPHEIWETLLMLALILLPLDVGIRRVHITREQVDRAREWIESLLRRRIGCGAGPVEGRSLAGPAWRGGRERCRRKLDRYRGACDFNIQTRRGNARSHTGKRRNRRRIRRDHPPGQSSSRRQAKEKRLITENSTAPLRLITIQARGGCRCRQAGADSIYSPRFSAFICDRFSCVRTRGVVSIASSPGGDNR